MAQVVTGLVRRPIKVKIQRGNEMLMEQIFQTTPIRIGRMLDNDLALPFDFISRYHCELRCEKGAENESWTAVDLGSKNGFLIESTQGNQVRLERINELKLEDGSSFFIQELNITLEYMEAVSFTESIHPTRGQTDTIVDTPAPNHELYGAQPVVEFDLQNMMFIPHPFAAAAKEHSLQMTTIWHDQILDTKDFSVGSPIVWDYNGRSLELGTVSKGKANVRVPKGCKAVDGAETNAKAPNTLVVSLTTPTAFTVSETIFVYFRFVPKSKELPKTMSWIDEKMMDPLVFSSAVHGTAALTAIVLGGRHHPTPVAPEPERFATIIMPAPTPAAMPTPEPTPVQVVVQPTPEPAPEPEPTPKPKKIAKVEPTPPPPKSKTIEKKVVKKVALKKKEEAPPPPQKQEAQPEPKVAVVDAPVVPAPPAPTPQPFNAKSVGALKAFALLVPSAPVANMANVEKIQVTRNPSSVNAPDMAATANQGTGEILTQLAQSSANRSKSDAASGVALGGKSAGGAYKVGGKGKAGNRAIKGSVLGGATYTELSKNDGLTREQVMKEVTKHQAEIQTCYEKSLMTNPDLSGSAEFEWEIAGSGSVNFAKVKSATLKNGEGLLDCVKGVFTKMKFPKAKNGENTNSTINLPFGRL